MAAPPARGYNVMIAITYRRLSTPSDAYSATKAMVNANKLLYGAGMAENINPYGVWERNFTQQMQRLREARKMTQTDLARELKAYLLPFHQQTIQRIESGERPVRLNEALLIAKVLGVDLNSMMVDGPPAVRELLYAIDRLRRTSGTVANELSLSLGEWLNEVEGFAFELSNRISSNPENPDEVTRWGLAWAQKVFWAYSNLCDTWGSMTSIEGAPGRLHEEEEWEGVLPAHDVMDTLKQWVDEYGRSAIEAAALDGANELYAKLPRTDVDDSDTQSAED